jgi:hypothetical protein
MAGLFLLSVASPFVYQAYVEYSDGLASRPPLVEDFTTVGSALLASQDDVAEEDQNIYTNKEGGMTRSDSEYSLGLSRSLSLNDIGRTNYNSLGLCTTGRVTYEIMKYCASAVVIMGILWQATELTKPKYKM